MKSLKSTICVRVDKNDKELARNQIKQPVLSQELLEALEEGEDILNGKIKSKKYHSVEELIQDLDNEV